MDIFVTYAIAIAAIVGLVNGFRLLRNWNKDPEAKWGFLFFVLALVAGIVFGYLKWFTIPSVETGLLVGLASSGFYRLTQSK